MVTIVITRDCTDDDDGNCIGLSKLMQHKTYPIDQYLSLEGVDEQLPYQTR